MQNEFIIISTADWDNPFWTNKQHIAKRLADRGYKVLYLNSMGLRAPSGNSKDLKRILRRFKLMFKGLQQRHDNLWVWSPIVIPYQKSSFVRKLNFLISKYFIKHYVKKLNFTNYILWTYNPISQPLLNKGEVTSVYHCVDEVSVQPGMPEEVIREQELLLVKNVDIVFATSQSLYEKRKSINTATYYSANVADFDHFSQARTKKYEIPMELKKLQGPIIGFIGAISGYKLDYQLIYEIAQSNPDKNFVFIGQVGEGDPKTNVSLIQQLKNVYLIGPKPYEELPRYLRHFDVCLLPNNLNEYTKNMFPMKFFEYLAAGKPVVMTPLHALQEYYHLCYVAKNPKEFSESINDALNEKNGQNFNELVNSRISEAQLHDWESRIDNMLDKVSQMSTHNINGKIGIYDAKGI
ncbi:glycosyl transferase [Paenibacillus sp. J45TS6]|uniref:glycosyltransferase n=1 Tax=Paenibacillus sp. J45TS6 TaxID=2807196 RepID=UPI001B0373C8|nr:glycosyltransferase [Paenibacillus sp. J45TS6]GIP44130.1 glycosyl transferase [Paenibacillus sp. J45TS6]